MLVASYSTTSLAPPLRFSFILEVIRNLLSLLAGPCLQLLYSYIQVVLGPPQSTASPHSYYIELLIGLQLIQLLLYLSRDLVIFYYYSLLYYYHVNVQVQQRDYYFPLNCCYRRPLISSYYSIKALILDSLQGLELARHNQFTIVLQPLYLHPIQYYQTGYYRVQEPRSSY